MWASYISHKIRLGKFCQVDYSHDLTIKTINENEIVSFTKSTSLPTIINGVYYV